MMDPTKDSTRPGWEQRWHPLRREWIVYSPHRNRRPWDGQAEPRPETEPAYDPGCYLCPGNTRTHGDVNPVYEDILVFDNDFPVVAPEAPRFAEMAAGPYRTAPAAGRARVMCYDPDHSRSMADLPAASVRRIFRVWRDETVMLSKQPDIRSVLVFENRGEIVGTSNRHPHCQIYATGFTFNNVEREMDAVRRYRLDQNGDLFTDIIKQEEKGPRVISSNSGALACIPHFARYPREGWVFPKNAHPSLATMNDRELDDLADAFHELIRRYDGLFGQPFPYVMSIYQAPFNDGDHHDYRMHLVLLPPLKQPGIKKFPAGPEIGGGNFMCDTLPEEAARELQNVRLMEEAAHGS